MMGHTFRHLKIKVMKANRQKKRQFLDYFFIDPEAGASAVAVVGLTLINEKRR